jgi:hypothetical protein
MNRLLKSGMTALMATGLALGVMQAPSVALTTTPSVIVKLGARAHLSSTGKVASVKVTITCKNATPAPIHVDVTQDRGSVAVTGSGDSAGRYKCNGRSQRGVVKVTADPGSRFNPGGASADASVTVSGATDTDSRNIQLTR